MNATTGPAGDVVLLIPGTEPLSAPPDVEDQDDEDDEQPECRFCHRPVRSMKSLRWRIGGKCRRKLRAKHRALLGIARRPRGGAIEQDPLPGL